MLHCATRKNKNAMSILAGVNWFVQDTAFGVGTDVYEIWKYGMEAI